MIKNTIGFIGGGNMAASLIGGILQTGVKADQITVMDIVDNPPAAAHGIRLSDQLSDILACDVVLFAVKPQTLPALARELASQLSDKPPLFISIAAGILAADLQNWLGDNVPLIRVMPNTPALVQSGASGLYAGKHVTDAHKQLAEAIVNAVGISIWAETEAQMDVITALSGSGPAYFFLIMEVMEKAATDLGLSHAQAEQLTLQTAYGAAKMAQNSYESSATLRQQVTSKGGTTEQAIKVLQTGGIEALFAQALTAASDRSAELAKLLAAK